MLPELLRSATTIRPAVPRLPSGFIRDGTQAGDGGKPKRRPDKVKNSNACRPADPDCNRLGFQGAHGARIREREYSVAVPAGPPCQPFPRCKHRPETRGKRRCMGLFRAERLDWGPCGAICPPPRPECETVAVDGRRRAGRRRRSGLTRKGHAWFRMQDARRIDVRRRRAGRISRARTGHRLPPCAAAR